jgi:hypothetical protein
MAASTANAATAIQLVLPQGTAFAILGHSCGGIQEKVYATGFDPASGYPTGVVQMSTSCGGSGRGGGYHTTTYSGSAGVTWDFTGAVVSYNTPATAGATGPTFTAYDSHGNEVYNQSNQAYLLLAAGFVPVARVIAVAPSAGPAVGGTSVTITGTGFTGATGVKFGTLSAKSFTVGSSGSITAVSPTAAAATVDVTVVNAGGASVTSASDQFTFVAAPTVTGISPNTGSPAGGMTVTITGTHLSGATRVSFGGTSAGFEVNGDTSITATSPGTAETGRVDVTVTTTGGTSVRTTADRFTYAAVRPVVTGIDPNSGSVDGGTVVTISGTNLTNVDTVAFGGVSASFSVDSDTSITAYAPAAASEGTVDVTASSFGLRSATSAADAFTYAANPAPTVTGVSPSTGPEAGGTIVTIAGTSLTNTVEVDFGGVSVPFGVIDDNTLIALTPAGSDGSMDVTVTTDGGTSATSAADLYTIVPPPTVTGVDPATGSVDGGESITISGSGFTDATEVDFGGVAASFTVNDDGSITTTAPPGSAGTVDIIVIADGGSSAASPLDEYTYE